MAGGSTFYLCLRLESVIKLTFVCSGSEGGRGIIPYLLVQQLIFLLQLEFLIPSVIVYSPGTLADRK